MLQDLIPGFGTAYVVSEWAIRLLMLIIVPLRRSPEATRSWLLLIFFLPIPGLLLYLAIGRPKFPQWRTDRSLQIAPLFKDVSNGLAQMEAPGPLPALARKLGGFPAVHGNHIAFLQDYDGTIDRLIADIDAAERHVRMIAYIFADDATGQRVIAALGRAAARGLPCHVIIDSFGTHRWLKGVMTALEAAGVKVHEALPFHLLRARTRRDMRNHRKLFIIDGLIGYAGSQNIVNKDFRPGVTNQELVVRVTGPVVAEMTALFLADWFLETEEKLDDVVAIPSIQADGAVAQLLPSGPDYPLKGLETLLIWQIHAAERQVTITTPYFIPNEALLDALTTAARRGVAVDIIVSAIADQMLVSLAQRSYYSELLAAGIRVHLFRDYLLHAKNMCIDGTLAIVGSSNVDIRSFQLNEEVSLLLLDPVSVDALATIQRGAIARSDPVDLEQWRKRSRLRKTTENAARLVSPLL
ncbi:cardiolipin synthase [Sphingobium boeckii]|uniref:Cardiolipin synthase n=1 Tax=Sphingobium boeckii TaxID=1082345 RepID=A0A7W9AIV7_9SPHN|nr:cardiolipin synthase [Sphingobium boeckii]MBB5686266.1 cardiolipin synthase [Sphingobium boeckii]